MIDPDDGQWLTYSQAAKVLGLPSPEAARSFARRRGWSRQTPNEIGAPARVQVPTGFGRRSRPAATGEETGRPTDADHRSLDGRPSADQGADSAEGPPADPAADRAVALAVEVAMLERIVADKEVHLSDLRQRLDAADRREGQLQVALADALAAQRKAADELSALRAAIEQRRAWGVLRRLYAAVRRA